MFQQEAVLGCQCCLDLFHDHLKTSRIMDGHFGERLAIQLNVRLVQSMNEFAVTQTMLTNSCIDTGDPQSAEVPFSDAAIAVGIDLSPHLRFHDGSP